MQSVALIDYGSGNLRSAEKALRPAAAARTRGHRRHRRSRDRGRAPTASCCPASAPSPPAWTRWPAPPGLIEAMNEAVQARGAPFLGICVGMQLLATARPGVRRDRRPRLDRRRGEEARARRPGAEGPAHGLERARRPSRDHAAAGGARASAPMYFTHSFALYPDRLRRRGGLCRPRRPVPRRCGAGQRGGRTVPPRKVPGRRPSPCWPTSWSGAHDPLSRHRPEGRPVRARAARRPGHGHGVQQLARPTRPSSFVDEGFSLDARGRPERRRRGPGRSTPPAVRGDPGGGLDPGAAGRRHPHPGGRRGAGSRPASAA